ncbi:MAG: endonuclease/exonuclease/phosphatase family protein [Planctomycetes bacterium]|nr:endonuclease/exonuclease/phosphatase family protein [Planctomycetota bacterium]
MIRRWIPVTAVVGLLALAAGLASAPVADGAGAGTGGATLRVATYNIKHALGMDGHIDLDRIAGVVSGFDVIGLQEVDRHNPRSSFRDQARHIADRLGMQHVFVANRYLLPFHLAGAGNAILTRQPILYSKNYLLYKPDGVEQRGMLRADLRIGDVPVHVYCCHLGLNAAERDHQLRQVLDITRQVGGNRILLGDFNTRDYAAQLRILSNVYPEAFVVAGIGQRFTFRSDHPTIKIDHIFVSGFTPRLSWVIDSQASDHRALAAELRIGG